MKANPDKIIVEKTPKHLYRVAQMKEMFPQAKFILIQRDVRDVIVSMMRATFHKFCLNFEDAFRQVIAMDKAIIKNQSIFDTSLHYEALVGIPENTLRRVLQDISLEYTDEEIKRAVEENHGKVKVNIPGAFDKGVVGSFEEELTGDEIHRVNNEFGL